MGDGGRVRAAPAPRRCLLALACVTALACAGGPKVAEVGPASQGGSTEALRDVVAVQVDASDKSIRTQAAQRLKKVPALRVVEEPAGGVPLLSLEFDCGNDFVFMGRVVERPYCNMLDDDRIQEKVTPPQTAAGSCMVSVVLSHQGQVVWWCKDTVRVGGRSDVVFATDRMVDRFTAAWQSARR
jgi:hypothetical protein